jgi:hypothetical protein
MSQRTSLLLLRRLDVMFRLSNTKLRIRDFLFDTSNRLIKAFDFFIKSGQGGQFRLELCGDLFVLYLERLNDWLI